MHIGFDVAELQVVSLKPGDVLSVKLVSDDFDEEHMASLKEQLTKVFPNNKIMIFTMPSNSDIVFEAIRQEATGCDTGSYCNDCNCGKKEQALGEKA